MQAADVDPSKRKLVKGCRTCWLSQGEAVLTMKAKQSATYVTINYFCSATDCTAADILHLI